MKSQLHSSHRSESLFSKFPPIILTPLREKGQSVIQNYHLQEIAKLIKMWLKGNPNKVEWISIYIYIYNIQPSFSITSLPDRKPIIIQY